MKIFFSVGEPSGDLHGANLIRELRRADESVDCVGYGGPRMQAEGCRLHEDLTQLAVMGLFPVLMHLHRFWLFATRADRYFRHARPDAVVLIDYPGFNWWIARRAKKHGIPVFYYGAPQLWAWASWRVNKMRRLVDHVLCKLPFEALWYRDRGCNAHFIGHPYFDELQSRVLDQRYLKQHDDDRRPLITILPGSRTQEVRSNMGCFARAAEIIHERFPEARFAVSCFKEKHVDMVRMAIGAANAPVEVFVGRTPELIHLATACMACSGSVSLELLYHEKPSVIHYRIGRWTWLVMSKIRLIKVRFITLVNLLAGDEPFAKNPQPYDANMPDADQVPFPEYPTCEDRSEQVAAHVIDWLGHETSRAACIEKLRALKSEIAFGGASKRASRYILDSLTQSVAGVPKPHFIDNAAVGLAVTQTDMVGETAGR